MVMNDIVAGSRCHELLRMRPRAFVNLCSILQKDGGLRQTLRASVEEQVAKFLIIVAQNMRSRSVKALFQRSAETVSRHFHSVLEAFIEIEEFYLRQPDGSQIPPEILNSQRFYPFFKDCVGAIDGTHIRVKVPAVISKRYRGRKDYPTQNVLAACTFDLKFTYVLPGWEGTASDSRIMKDALTRVFPLKIPQGKYYLVDAGFMINQGLITPFRSTRYHLKEYSTNPPQNYRELFNHRHSSLRNAIERAFGVLKKRFPILSSGNEPLFGVETHKKIVVACCILHNYLMGIDPDIELIRRVDEELANQTDTQFDYVEPSSLDEGIMLKRKEAPEEALVWTDAMDEALLDVLIEQIKLGNRVGGTFTKTAYDNVCTQLRNMFPLKNLQKSKIFDHFKNMKRKFTPWYDVFKQGLSGFSWDPITCKWDAEPAVWEKLIEERPVAAKLRNKSYPLYHKFVEVYGLDRATGDNAQTAAEMRLAKKSTASSLIEEVDRMVIENEISLENFPENDVIEESFNNSATPTSSQRVKRKKSKVTGDEFEVVREGLKYVGDCLMKSTSEMINQNKIDELSIWSLMEEMEVGDDNIASAYCFLVENLSKVKALLVCPAHKRNEVLKIMMKAS